MDGLKTLEGQIPSPINPPPGCAFHQRCPYACPDCARETPQPVDLGGAAVLPGDFVLVEDLGNLLANELWSPAGAGRVGAEARILSGVRALMERAALLAVVSVDIFAGGDGYDPETLDYIRTLGRLHRALAALAEETAEVVCGIPLAGKGLPAYNEHRPAAPAGQEA